MVEENISQEFRWKNIDKIRNCKKNRKLTRNKQYQKVSLTLNNYNHFFILTSMITGCISISAFVSVFGVASYAIGLKICAVFLH